MVKVNFSDADKKSFLRIKECVKDIVDNTQNMTEEKWNDEGVQYVFKDALVKLAEACSNATDAVKQLLGEIDEDFADIDCIIHYCIDGWDGRSPNLDNYDKQKEDPGFVSLCITRCIPILLQKMNDVTI